MIAVLCVDDEPALLALARHFLEEEGAFSVETALSADEAIARLAEREYDAVVSDYKMSGVDGIGLLKYVRRRHADLPFILFTGRGREEVAMMAINNGADFYLQKGGDPAAQFAELANQIRQAVRWRRAEQALRVSEEKFRGIAERSSDIIFIADRDLRISYVSPSVERVLGYSPAEVIGRPSISFVADEDLAMARAIESEAINGRFVSFFEVRARRKDDSTAHLELQAIPIHAAGRLDGVQFVARDVSEREEAEEALRKSEERFRGMAERSSDLILVLDERFSPTYVSPSVTRILGYHPDEVVGRPLDTTIMPQHDIDLVREATARAAGENREGEIEIHVARKDGSMATLAAHGIPVMADGACIGVQVQARDITAHKQAEEALLRANRQLNILSTVTRHDIMNKIMVLRGYCGIAQELTRDAEMLRVIGEMESVGRIINDQIEFTRIYKDLGSQAPRWQEITTLLPCEHVPPGVSFTADIAGVEIYADAMLGKVFYNLLDNSLRHGGRMTAIRIGGAETAAGLAIAWEDNGIGIPAAEKERIFERGYGKNTGLGLFIAREILAISGIGIAETGRYLRGARFEILVPKGSYRRKTTV